MDGLGTGADLSGVASESATSRPNSKRYNRKKLSLGEILGHRCDLAKARTNASMSALICNSSSSISWLDIVLAKSSGWDKCGRLSTINVTSISQWFMGMQKCGLMTQVQRPGP